MTFAILNKFNFPFFINRKTEAGGGVGVEVSRTHAISFRKDF